jgi:hypothetical protein
MADVVDLAAARERRDRMVRVLADVVIMRLAGADVAGQYSLIAEQFPELRGVA